MPRLGLATLPTPLQETPRLAAALGLDHLLLKRDDNTGLALGGNKARKLEYLVADAARAGADMLLTLGAPQSNHCRMTAAAARVAGMDSHFVFAGPSIDEVQANMLLDRFFGATWTFAGDQPTPERMAQVAQELRARAAVLTSSPVAAATASARSVTWAAPSSWRSSWAIAESAPATSCARADRAGPSPV